MIYRKVFTFYKCSKIKYNKAIYVKNVHIFSNCKKLINLKKENRICELRWSV